MKNNRIEIAQLLIGILCTVFGAWTMDTIMLVFFEGKEFSGHNMMFVNILFFVTWYLIASFLFVTAYPDLSKRILLSIGIVSSVILVLAPQVWTDPNLNMLSKLFLWFEINIQYLLATPVFWLMYIITRQGKIKSAANT